MGNLKLILDDISKEKSKWDDIVSSIAEKQIKEINNTLEIYCKEYSVPKIKGEITKGKLRWRGLKLIIQNSGTRQWVEQRGKRISPIIENGNVALSSLRGLTTINSSKGVDSQINDLRNEWDRQIN